MMWGKSFFHNLIDHLLVVNVALRSFMYLLNISYARVVALQFDDLDLFLVLGGLGVVGRLVFLEDLQVNVLRPGQLAPIQGTMHERVSFICEFGGVLRHCIPLLINRNLLSLCLKDDLGFLRTGGAHEVTFDLNGSTVAAVVAHHLLFH